MSQKKPRTRKQESESDAEIDDPEVEAEKTVPQVHYSVQTPIKNKHMYTKNSVSLGKIFIDLIFSKMRNFQTIIEFLVALLDPDNFLKMICMMPNTRTSSPRMRKLRICPNLQPGIILIFAKMVTFMTFFLEKKYYNFVSIGFVWYF